MGEKRLHCFFSGRVQGVFFRAHIAGFAQKLGVKGTVKNLADGRVEFVGEGKEESLRKLVEMAKTGNPRARVGKTEERWGESKKEFNDFRTIY